MAISLDDLKTQKSSLQDRINSSNTFLGSNSTPERKDLSLNSQLASINKRIEDQRSKEIRNRLYGKDLTGAVEQADKPSGIMGLFSKLQKPLNAVVGTGQYALGKGTESSLSENINKSMEEGRTWGNVLAQYDMSRAAQIGLGFMLDVATDPVNLVTGGSQNLIPRVGLGLMKGGGKEAVLQGAEAGLRGSLKAAGKGVTSWGEKAAADAMGMVPFVKKIGAIAPKIAEDGASLGFKDTLKNAVIKGSEKYSGWTKEMGARAVKSADEFDSMLGRTVMDDLGKIPMTGISSGIVGDTAEKLVRKYVPKGDKIVDFMKYSPAEFAEATQLKSRAKVLARENMGVELAGSKVADFQTIEELNNLKATVKWPITETTAATRKAGNKTIEGADEVLQKFEERQIRYQSGAQKGELKKEFKGNITLAETKDNSAQILNQYNELFEDRILSKAFNVTERGQTGFAAYDKVIDNLKKTTIRGIIDPASRKAANTLKTIEADASDLVNIHKSYDNFLDIKPFEAVLNFYPKYISSFKLAKVALNAGSHVIANIGNFFMGAMMGLPVHSPEFMNEVVNARKLLSGKAGYNAIREQISVFSKLMREDPDTFINMSGVDPYELYAKLKMGDKVLNNSEVFAEAQKFLEQIWLQSEEAVAWGTKLDDAEKAFKGGSGIDRTMATGSKTMLNAEKVGDVYDASKSSSMIVNEAADLGHIEKWKSAVAQALSKNKNNPVYIAADFMMNRMPIAYERIDQSWKIGTTNFLVKKGLTRSQLEVVSRSVKIGEGDILEVITEGAEKRYKLTGIAASRVSLEAFMNYSAMPDFVKMMRAMPVVGSSFFSFPYAMTVRMGKTVMDNPAIFNKVAFMMNEMNASRTPQERMALEDKYNQYMNSPSVVKVLGMWNLNMKNLIPYMSMNMFNPSERNYDESSTMGKIFKATDKLPFLQDPIGQMVKDYWIQPWMLSGAINHTIPQGQFGQPLYDSFDNEGNPIKPSFGTKVFASGKAVTESVVPGILGYTGLLNAVTRFEPEVINKLPLGYAFAGMANAPMGRGTNGAMTAEDPFRKTLKTAVSRTGLPSYILDPNMVSSGAGQ